MTILSDEMRQRLASGEILLGLCSQYPSAAVVESMCPGWDFVWIDMQHGQHDYASALEAVRTTQALGLASMLRVDTHDSLLLGKYTDTGTTAILIPMVNSSEQAKEMVVALRYPPSGERSFASRRLVDLVGTDHHLKTAPLLVVQIETPQALQSAEAIAAVDGVDALFFGPDDFRLASGIAYDVGLTEHLDLARAAERTAAAAVRAGKHAVIPAPTPALLKQAIAWGYRLMIGGTDAGFVRISARTRLAELDAVRRDAPQHSTGQAPGGGYG